MLKPNRRTIRCSLASLGTKDPSTSSTFASYVSGYQNLNVNNVLSRNVSGLNADTVYFYRVRAYNSGGTSGNSSTITASTAIDVPSAPIAVAAGNVTGEGFQAKWNGSAGATGYRLDVSRNTAFSSYVSGYSDLDAGDSLSRSINGLSAGETYYYRVRAYNESGVSGNSGTIAVVTQGGTPVLIFSNQDGNLLVSWPTSFTAFALESTADLAASNWTWNAISPGIVNGRYIFTNPTSGEKMFFRLRK